MQMIDEEKLKANLNAERSCLSCAKLNVCAPLRAISQLLQTWEDKKPFSPENLAKICVEYLSASIVKNLEEMQ